MYADNENAIKNPFIRNVFMGAKAKGKNFFRKCPLFGKLSLVNFAPSKTFINIMPTGKYVVKFSMYDDQSGSKLLWFDMQVTFMLVAD